MKKVLDIIGVQMDVGASQRGVAMGPLAIRYGGVVAGLERLGYSVEDKDDIQPIRGGASRDDMRSYECVIDAGHKLYDSVMDTLEAGHMPIVLGGDHSIAAGSISAVSKHYEKKGGIGVIWIDAHGDWNDNTTSDTGNMHGMPYSALCGYGPDMMVDYGQQPAYLDVTKCVQIAARDLDQKEKERMRKAGITVFSMADIDKLGMHEVMKRAMEIASYNTAGIHVSFDVDSITPAEAPGTGTPVLYGITTREAHLALEMMAASGRLLSMDMVEVNPILDTRNKTGILASELIQSALGKTVY